LNRGRGIFLTTPPDNYFRMGFHAINPDAIVPGVEVLRGQLEQIG
jgi:GntR family transcriptional regulator/MocR family aminotransferase